MEGTIHAAPVESPPGDEWSTFLLHGLLTIPAKQSLSSRSRCHLLHLSSHTAPLSL